MKPSEGKVSFYPANRDECDIVNFSGFSGISEIGMKFTQGAKKGTAALKGGGIRVITEESDGDMDSER